MPTNRTKYLYHVTHKNNWYPIGVLGLRTDFTNGQRPAIWLVTAKRILWAAKHLRKRDGTLPHDLIVVKVRVRRSDLRRNRVRGVWYSKQDIAPCKIEETMSLFEYWRANPGSTVGQILTGTER